MHTDEKDFFNKYFLARLNGDSQRTIFQTYIYLLLALIQNKIINTVDSVRNTFRAWKTDATEENQRRFFIALLQNKTGYIQWINQICNIASTVKDIDGGIAHMLYNGVMDGDIDKNNILTLNQYKRDNLATIDQHYVVEWFDKMKNTPKMRRSNSRQIQIDVPDIEI